MRKVLLPLTALLLANDAPVVKELRAEMITIYDQDGVRIAREKRWALPAGGAPIVGHNTLNQVGIRHDGKVVYLRASEIVTENDLGICQIVSNAAADGKTRSAVSGGIASGGSANHTMCLSR